MLQLIARTYSLAKIFQVLQEWSILADIFVLTFSKVFFDTIIKQMRRVSHYIWLKLVWYITFLCIMWSVKWRKTNEETLKGSCEEKDLIAACWKSCKCDDTNDKSVFWWLAGRTKGDGFCWWSVEEEAKENTLSDVEELLNANWIHSFTFQFQATALRDVKKIRRKYKWNAKENTVSGNGELLNDTI